jgi:Cd2+/Zn2+-exporting ATPase
MEKTKINLNIVLPEVPDERDDCVDRVIDSLKSRRGIDKIHLVPHDDENGARICFHYDPSQISIDEVTQLATKAGGEILERYGHLLIDVSGLQYPRHAGIIEHDLQEVKGILSVSIAATGFIQLEYDKTLTTVEKITKAIKGFGLSIKNIDDFRSPSSTKKCQDDHHHLNEPKIGCCGGHTHEHNGIFGEKTELIFSIICGTLMFIGFGLTFIDGVSIYVPIAFYIGAYLFGGWYTTKEAYEGISNGQFEIDFLMLVAAVGAAILGHWVEGALLLFLFSLSHSLEHYAMEKAKKSITALAQLTPKVAILKIDNELREIPIEQLKVGDIISVKPNSTIAADGMVILGNSSVNQAPITGESMPADKMPVEDLHFDIHRIEKLPEENRVFAGTINGSQSLEIKVSKLSSDSTIARLVQLVKEAQTQKSKTQIFTNKIEKIYVPAVLIAITLLLFAFLVIDEPFGASFYRAMAVLVAASPCALAIATPSAVLSGVARAARGGVLIKGGRPLEELGALRAIAFDKTGTLTEGKPKLTGVYPLHGFDDEKLLSIIISVEKLSDHPLAAAIVKGGIEKLQRDVSPAENVSSIVGHGVKADYENSIIHIGNKKLFEQHVNLTDKIKTKVEDFEKAGNTTMIVQQNDRFIGIITLMDTIRKDAKETIAQLRKMGIKRMVMLTGDNQMVADSIAAEIGIEEAWGSLLPEQKVSAIDQLNASEKFVAMLGDGVNDAPAMAKSSVGIAMGVAGSDVALETADVALMADRLNTLPFAIGLGKKAKTIIKQNLIISLGMVVVLVPLTILGYATIGPAVVGHEGSTLLVVFNALRLLGYSHKK